MEQDALLPAIAWLAASEEPAVRRAAQLEFLGIPWSEGSVANGRIVSSLLSGQQADGSFGVHPYRKWTGAHWRLVSLVDLGVTAADAPSLPGAADTVLEWLHSDQHRSQIRSIGGLTRRCASQEGNALYVCSRLGMAADPRVSQLARDLVRWQWPDGGWNCDVEASGRRSSFHETLPAAKGLHAYWMAGGDPAARAAAERAAELLLAHRLFKSSSTGRPIDPRWLKLRYPEFWHYGILPALLLLSRMGLTADPRAGEAAGLLRGKMLPDGRWPVEGAWWYPPGAKSQSDVTDWGRTGPNEFVTLSAVRILAAGPGLPAAGTTPPAGVARSRA
ncbi:hypothetical protein [Arthrobacter sp. U41]|uniref:hypothetical protein n=1 Tax=Arthrobacter sp. U41 TaxID=1849032 RepID=UPI0008595D6E|nr:hypothetical protein [Arthrobacter sp. U41]AOT04472.1 hypothetical protein ASPU41_15290 [Arthrobacter sp. U41]